MLPNDPFISMSTGIETYMLLRSLKRTIMVQDVLSVWRCIVFQK